MFSAPGISDTEEGNNTAVCMKTHVIILGVNIQKRSTANAHKQKEGKNICLTKMNSNFPKRCEFNTVCITAQHTPILHGRVSQESVASPIICSLLYSTWNSAQCYVPALMGKGFRGEQIHVYVWMNPFADHLKLSHHC